MGDIEKDLECVKDMCKRLEEVAKAELSKGTEQVDTDEMYKVVDMIKDFSEVKKNVAKMHYYKSVVEAMEKSNKDDEVMSRLDEYGVEGERRYYNGNRYSNGRYAPKGYGNYARRGYDEPMYYSDYPNYRMTAEDYRTMSPDDLRRRDYSQGKMYYTEPNMSYYTPNMSNTSNSNTMASRYDMARRNYTESKMSHSGNSSEDKQMRMRELENYTKELASDVTEMISNASPEEKTLLKNKMQTLIQKIQ